MDEAEHLIMARWMMIYVFDELLWEIRSVKAHEPQTMRIHQLEGGSHPGLL
jgi:hypothetical protein